LIVVSRIASSARPAVAEDDVMNPTTAAIANSFNDAITRRDLDGLTALMAPDHTFTDTEGGTVTGRTACRAAWEGFFATFPDYRNVFTTIIAAGDRAVLAGYSVCAEPALDGPALWTATVHDGLVAGWTVHRDTPDNRRQLGLPARGVADVDLD
jgi:ketosteroid isomerase-like protein